MNRNSVTSTRISQYFTENRLREKDIPLAMSLELTARCNNNCRHCYVNLEANDQEGLDRELSLVEIEQIADQAVSMGTLWCLLSGGEPLLRSDFGEIYQMLVKKGLLVSLYTNGTLINQDHVRLFLAHPPRAIELTVYGVTSETYARVTGHKHNYQLFRKGLQLLLDHGIPVQLKTMALRSNLAELSNIADFCRQRTKGLFRFDPFLHLRTDGDEKRNQLIISERLSPEEIAEIEHRDFERSNSLLKNCQLYIQEGEVRTEADQRLFRCNLGAESFCVSYDGMLRVCHSLCETTCCYDLRRGTLADAWQRFRPDVQRLQINSRQVTAKCDKCKITNLCFLCPATSHLESGQLESWSEYFCEVARARARALQERIVKQDIC